MRKKIFNILFWIPVIGFIIGMVDFIWLIIITKRKEESLFGGSFLKSIINGVYQGIIIAQLLKFLLK